LDPETATAVGKGGAAHAALAERRQAIVLLRDFGADPDDPAQLRALLALVRDELRAHDGRARAQRAVLLDLTRAVKAVSACW
jgi:hypothetical protein